MSPSSQLHQGSSKNKPEESKNELLNVQIAGILSPPVKQDSYSPEQFLERIAKKRTLVSCELLGRVVPVLREDEEESESLNKGQPSPNLGNPNGDATLLDSATIYRENQVALCRLTYRPNWLFSADLAETLIKAGNANVASSILHSSATDITIENETNAFKSKIIDTSQRIQVIRGDVKYLDRLAMLEFEAAQNSKGMWSVQEVRESKKEIVEEVDFQAKANLLQKIWRRIRGG